MEIINDASLNDIYAFFDNRQFRKGETPEGKRKPLSGHANAVIGHMYFEFF